MGKIFFQPSYKTRDGCHLLVNSQTRDHLLAHSEIDNDFMAELTTKLILPRNGSFFHEEVEMGRIVGRAGRAATKIIGLDDVAMFSFRKGRIKPSRIIMDGEAPWTSKVVVMAEPTNDPLAYSLITAYVGTKSEREPHNCFIGSVEEYLAAVKFWCKEALVFDKGVTEETFFASWREIVSEFGNSNFADVSI